MEWSARTAAAGIVVCVLTPVAAGQETPATAAEGIRRFDPPYFAQFNPVTAYDMVRQLPGFFIDSGDPYAASARRQAIS